MVEPTAEEEHRHVYPKNLNPQIHGLRGLATLLVFIYHLYGVGNLWGFWPTSLDPMAGFFLAGRFGVEIFFIISGYLIVGSLLRHADATRFLVDRCIRIYPVFLTIHVLVFTLGPLIGYKWMAGITPIEWATAFVTNVLFVPGLFDLSLAQLNAWSLSYEACFYLLCAAALIATRRFGKIFAIVALSAIGAELVLSRPLACFFITGTAIFFISSWRPTAVPRAVRHLSVAALITMLIVLTAGVPSVQTDMLACVPGFLFFWSIVEGRCALSTCLRWHPLQYLGTISYSFYLWSPFVTYPMKLAIDKFLLGRVDPLVIWLLFAALGLAASLVTAHFSYMFLEDRAGDYFKARLKKRLPLPIAVSSFADR